MKKRPTVLVKLYIVTGHLILFLYLSYLLFVQEFRICDFQVIIGINGLYNKRPLENRNILRSLLSFLGGN